VEALVILGALALAANKTVSVIKGLKAGDWNLVLTQVVVWMVGIAALFLIGASNQFQGLVIPGFTQPLTDFDAASKVALGWMLGGSGSFAFDIKKAIDRSDNAREPSLLGEATTAPPNP
jgi:hypothetical protein